MKNSSKAAILIIGIFIGLIAGIALASWMDYEGYEINPVQKVIQLFTPGNDMKDEDVFYQADPSLNGQNSSSDKNQNTKSKTSKDNELMKSDQKVSRPEPSDTLSYTDQNQGTADPQEPIKLATDQLIDSKTLKIIGFIAEKTPNLDSLLIDDKYTSRSVETIKVELWYSPINYTGYKWINNKLAVFGYYDMELVKIKFTEGAHYFNYGKHYYKVEPTSTFKSLDVIQDAALIKKLNSL